MINFKGEKTSEKIDILKDFINWLCHEMEEGRVNNNNLALIKETSEMKTPLSIAFVRMVENGEIDEVTASENADMFLSWHENITFNAGDFRTYSTEESETKLYKCLQSHTSQADWTPDVSPALWKEVGITENGIPEWSQSISSADAYMLNDEVMHNGSKWVSDYDNNVWEPGVFGWHIKEGNEEATPQIPESPSGDTVLENEVNG